MWGRGEGGGEREREGQGEECHALPTVVTLLSCSFVGPLSSYKAYHSQREDIHIHTDHVYKISPTS